jgi:hypothetical protein
MRIECFTNDDAVQNLLKEIQRLTEDEEYEERLEENREELEEMFVE